MTFITKEMRATRVLAGAAIVVTGLAFAPGATLAQTTAPARAREAARETKQESKEATRATGNAMSDSWITMKVSAQFVPEDALEDSDIDVDTKAGVVSLMGTVTTAKGRDRAAQIAKATDGVKSVNNRLRIAPERDDDRPATTGAAGAATREGARETKSAAKGAGRGVSDGWLTSKIYADFIDEDALEGSDIDVDTNAGVVTLKGTVPTQAGLARAAAVAKAIDGVKSVRNNLKVMKAR